MEKNLWHMRDTTARTLIVYLASDVIVRFNISLDTIQYTSAFTVHKRRYEEVYSINI